MFQKRVPAREILYAYHWHFVIDDLGLGGLGVRGGL